MLRFNYVFHVGILFFFFGTSRFEVIIRKLIPKSIAETYLFSGFVAIINTPIYSLILIFHKIGIKCGHIHRNVMEINDYSLY